LHEITESLELTIYSTIIASIIILQSNSFSIVKKNTCTRIEGRISIPEMTATLSIVDGEIFACRTTLICINTEKRQEQFL
jgi:hypothetical protein